MGVFLGVLHCIASWTDLLLKKHCYYLKLENIFRFIHNWDNPENHLQDKNYLSCWDGAVCGLSNYHLGFLLSIISIVFFFQNLESLILNVSTFLSVSFLSFFVMTFDIASLQFGNLNLTESAIHLQFSNDLLLFARLFIQRV